MRIALEADITGLDPIIPGLQNYYVIQNIYNTLVTVDANFEIAPELAESWDIQDGAGRGKNLFLSSASRR